MVYFQSETLKAWKRLMAQIKGSQAAEIPSYLEEGQPFGQSGLQLIIPGPPTLRRAVNFIQFINLKVKCILNHPQGNTQKNIWAPSFSVKLTHKINHHNTQHVTGPNINTGHS